MKCQIEALTRFGLATSGNLDVQKELCSNRGNGLVKYHVNRAAAQRRCHVLFIQEPGKAKVSNLQLRERG